jgi:predicted ATPase
MATSNDKIYEILIDIQGRVCAIETLAPTVNELEKIVMKGSRNGSVTQPLTQRMDCVETAIKSQKDTEKEKKDNKTWFNRAIVGAIVAQSVGLLIALFK